MANGLPPPARIPSTEAIRRAALARSARRGARVAAWRVGLRWLLWGTGHFLVGLGALSVAAALLLGLRWGWQAAQSRWSTPSAPLAVSAPSAQPPTSPKPPTPTPAPTAAPTATPAPSNPSFPLRLDDSDPWPAAARGASAAAQSPPPRNPKPNTP